MAEGRWPPPGFPLVEGRYRLTAVWSIHLPEQFARRIEDESLVLWRPGLTIWLVAWGNNHAETHRERLARIKQSASPGRFAERESEDSGLTRFSYRLRDESENGPIESVYGFAIGDRGHLQMSIYFDDLSEEELARQLTEIVTAH